MKILIVSPEMVPFAKTGGLADVIGALPKALKQLGHDVRVVIPKYRTVDDYKYDLKLIKSDLKISIGSKNETAQIYEAKVFDPEIIVYFVDNKNGTTIEYVQAFEGSDDGFEFFGGTVNTKYLVSTS